jgi:hypothetical protein
MAMLMPVVKVQPGSTMRDSVQISSQPVELGADTEVHIQDILQQRKQ